MASPLMTVKAGGHSRLGKVLSLNKIVKEFLPRLPDLGLSTISSQRGGCLADSTFSFFPQASAPKPRS
jgi:hypothetical protein